MSDGTFAPGALWARIVEQTARARRCGKLQSLATEQVVVEQGGVRFVLRRLASLARKAQDKGAAAGRPVNPFLPYDQDLWVADLSPGHVALLNKFNVVDHHLLIVTRAFVDQETLLDAADFAALAACLGEYPSLAFYNGGRAAGASQPHKHLQLVPLPLADGAWPVPIEAAFAAARFAGDVGATPALPFAHGLVRLDPAAMDDVATASGHLLAGYHAALAAAGLPPAGQRQPGPYNLLATRRWLFLVPRAQECCAGVSINALGFAGALLARDAVQLQALIDRGPLTALQEVALPLTEH